MIRNNKSFFWEGPFRYRAAMGKAEASLYGALGDVLPFGLTIKAMPRRLLPVFLVVTSVNQSIA